MRLITIPLSHYCERARWALDRSGVPYQEDRHLQGFHIRAVRKVARGHRVPVLVTKDQVLTDSQDILEFADSVGARLYPDSYGDSDRAFECDLADEFGVETRRVAYHHCLALPASLLLKYNNTGAPWHQRIASRFMVGALAKQVRDYLNITPETVNRGRETILRYLDQVAEHRSDDRPFLAGDVFTALDLTFASLLAPLLMVSEYGVPLPPIEQLPSSFRSLVEELRAHPSGAFALQLYKQERRLTVGSG